MIEELINSKYSHKYPCYTDFNNLDSVYGWMIKFSFHWYSWDIKSPYMLMEYWSKHKIIYHQLSDDDLDYLYKDIESYFNDSSLDN